MVGERDTCLLRHWERAETGVFQISAASHTHHDCPLSHRRIRARVHALGYSVAPIDRASLAHSPLSPPRAAAAAAAAAAGGSAGSSLSHALAEPEVSDEEEQEDQRGACVVTMVVAADAAGWCGSALWTQRAFGRYLATALTGLRLFLDQLPCGMAPVHPGAVAALEARMRRRRRRVRRRRALHYATSPPAGDGGDDVARARTVTAGRLGDRRGGQAPLAALHARGEPSGPAAGEESADTVPSAEAGGYAEEHDPRSELGSVNGGDGGGGANSGAETPGSGDVPTGASSVTGSEDGSEGQGPWAGMAALEDLEAISSTVPYRPDTRHAWSRPLAGSFNVRGKHYLDDRVKSPSQPCAFRALGVDLLHARDRVDHVASLQHSGTYWSIVQREAASRGLRLPHMFIVNMQMPGNPPESLVVYMARELPEGEDPQLDRLWKQCVARPPRGRWGSGVGVGSTFQGRHTCLHTSTHMLAHAPHRYMDRHSPS